MDVKVAVGIATLNRPDLLDRCLDSVDRQRGFRWGDLFVVQNGPAVGHRCATLESSVVIRCGYNIGLPASMNLMLKAAWEAGYTVMLILNDDMVLSDDRTLDIVRECFRIPRQFRYLHARGYSAVCISRAVWDEVGPLDEGFWPCLVPETPVLKADLSWAPIGTVKVGDVLVGVDEMPERPRASRSYRPTHVQSVHWQRAECVRLMLEDGREVCCSTTHRWLTKLPAPSGQPYRWRATGDLHPGYRLCAPLRTWPVDGSYEAGWLAGFLDGEGSMHRGQKMRGLSFSQNKGAVLDRAQEVLHGLGLAFRTYRRVGNEKLVLVEVNQRRHVIEALGRLRPIRLLDQGFWNGLRVRSRTYRPDLEVVKMRPAGMLDVVDLQTDHRTFIANGIVSHNCYYEDNDHHRRVILAGIPWDEIVVATEHVGSASLTPEFAPLNAHAFSLNTERYQAKWGGLPGHETYIVPWDGGQPMAYTRTRLPADVVARIEAPYA